MRVKHLTSCFLTVLLGIGVWSPSLTNAQSGDQPICLFVSSYHVGYAWSDGIEGALSNALSGKCKLIVFHMDTKRQKTFKHKIAAGKTAYQMVVDLQPDVVITADDNAAKYLIVPHLLEKPVPVVFSGINWTVSEYGLPASNTTGIVEVAPIRPMLLEGLKANNLQGERGISIVYLAADTLSDNKSFERIKNIGQTLGMEVDGILIDDFASWKQGFIKAQEYDMVVMGSYSGITGFAEAEAIAWVDTHTRKLSTTYNEWMMPYSVIGYTKIAEEHGEWAAASALAILGGLKASDIPLVTNRRWDTWINTRLLSRTNIALNDTIVKQAKKWQ